MTVPSRAVPTTAVPTTSVLPSATFPPLPPEPPHPPRPRHDPWHPEPRPVAPGTASASASVVVGDDGWLARQLLERRVIALSGHLDEETANRTVAQLALLDATGDDPVALRLSGVTADLGAALTLLDALDLTGVPVHVTCLGTLTGAALVLVAAADVRTAGPHAVLQLTEPRSPRPGPGREVEALAAAHARDLRRLQERLAGACGRPVEEVAADMRAGRLLDAQKAVAYGLIDTARPAGRR